MNVTEAQELIIFEGTDERGIVVMVRMGGDPGAVRMRRLLKAIRIVFESLEGREEINRRLAHALFRLVYYVPWNIHAYANSGARWRHELTAEEEVDLICTVESIFRGVWRDRLTI